MLKGLVSLHCNSNGAKSNQPVLILGWLGAGLISYAISSDKEITSAGANSIVQSLLRFQFAILSSGLASTILSSIGNSETNTLPQ